MAFNLARAAAVAAGLAKARWASLRRKIIRVAARIASTSRRLDLHLPTHWPCAHGWHNIHAIATGPPLTSMTWPPSPNGPDQGLTVGRAGTGRQTSRAPTAPPRWDPPFVGISNAMVGLRSRRCEESVALRSELKGQGRERGTATMRAPRLREHFPRRVCAAWDRQSSPTRFVGGQIARSGLGRRLPRSKDHGVSRRRSRSLPVGVCSDCPVEAAIVRTNLTQENSAETSRCEVRERTAGAGLIRNRLHAWSRLKGTMVLDPPLGGRE